MLHVWASANVCVETGGQKAMLGMPLQLHCSLSLELIDAGMGGWEAGWQGAGVSLCVSPAAVTTDVH